jgi:hypothetical protein
MNALTQEEFDELLQLFSYEHFSKQELESARAVHPLDPRPNTGAAYAASVGYLFKCKTCTDIGMDVQWYRLVLDTIGGSPLFHQRTSEEDLRNGFDDTNLAKITDDADYYSSGLNYIEGTGYVCDHCRESIFVEK